MRKKSIACVLVLAFSLSLVSAMPAVTTPQLMAQTAEAQAVGGNAECARAWGLGLALGLAALSPCGVVCACLAWYDLALIGAYCD